MSRAVFILASLVVLLSGCATKNVLEFSDVPAEKKAIPDGYGQIIIYRNNPIGIIQTLPITVDGVVYGSCNMSYLTVVNLKPGKRRVRIAGIAKSSDAGADADSGFVDIKEGKRI